MADGDIWAGAPGGGLTYDEWHAAVMGLVGAVAGVAVYARMWGAVIGFSTLTIGTAWGLRALPESTHKICARVVRREPWYFTAVYVLSAAVAAALLFVVVG